jgi:hypothetical protein
MKDSVNRKCDLVFDCVPPTVNVPYSTSSLAMPTSASTASPPYPPELTAKVAQLLGIAVAKVAVYGGSHPAGREAVQAAFGALQPMLAARRTLELSTEGGELLLDGKPMVADAAAGRLLGSQIRRHGPDVGFVLSEPLRMEELVAFVGLVGSPPPPADRQECGLAKAVAEAKWQSIRMASGHYVRVDGPGGEEGGRIDGKVPAAAQKATAARLAEQASAGMGGTHVVDLSVDLALGSDVADTVRAAGGGRSGGMDATIDADRLETLVQRLQQVATLLEGRLAAMPDEGESIVQELRGGVKTAARTAHDRVQALAADLAADRDVVGRLEADAFQRGIVLRASRDALLARLAELHQELLQPLTVASGVVESMVQGNLGPISMPQRSLLQLAFESIGSVTQLATHITELVGYPAGLCPPPPTRGADRGRQPP